MAAIPVHSEDFKKGRLQRSRTVTGLGDIVVEPVHPERQYIRVNLPSAARKELHLTLLPEEAYWLGDALVNHAKECGFDPSVED
jgi:hypothetical protein